MPSTATVSPTVLAATGCAIALLTTTAQAAGPQYRGGAQQPTYAEQVKELEAVGGDPSFLEPPTSWDGSIDESAHFGGWEGDNDAAATSRAATKTTKPVSTSASYAELKKEIEGVGGDPAFLMANHASPLSGWDGSIDESAYFGGWES